MCVIKYVSGSVIMFDSGKSRGSGKRCVQLVENFPSRMADGWGKSTLAVLNGQYYGLNVMTFSLEL